MISQMLLFMIVSLTVLCIVICAVRFSTMAKGIRKNVTALIKYNMPPLFYVNDQESVDIQNKHDCNLETLRVCDVDDPITIMGCKEFAVRCINFKKEISYIEDGEITMRIPKNSSPREGYVLAIKDLAKSCNPYHGDLVLISSGLRENEYLLICNCKNPGIIGNDTLTGSCESVHICNGKVKDINKPLDQIECSCEKAEVSKRMNESEIPICVPITVREANDKYNDWSSFVQWGSRDTISTESLSLDYKTNLPDRILDPCRNSIIDTSVSIPNGQYDKDAGTCRFHDYGIPFSIGLFTQSKKNPNDSNAAVFDCAIHTRLPYQFVRVTGGVDGYESVLAINVDAKTVVVFPDEKKKVGVGESAQIMITTKPEEFYAPACDALKFKLTYTCYMRNHYNLMENGLPRALAEPHPFLYLWDYEDWDRYEGVAGKGSLDYAKDGLRITNLKTFLAGEQLAAYGVKFGREESGVLSFKNLEDYRLHEQASF